ncbi:hypothetical protein [Spirochaeta cellobiosiphila]|uniref:hypothetical protein n=1 Tax=Spirochaeta cellobiosiphila TaxID=504483 RepID=UPI00069F9119|nr:hypothetical protein [Spirochaeta cellobiosiphila]
MKITYAFLSFSLLFLSCSSQDSKNEPISPSLKKEMNQRLYQDNQTEETRFYILMSLVDKLQKNNSLSEVTQLINNQLSHNPEDYYNGYYLYLLGQSYEQMGNAPFANYYYRQALMNYPDMVIKDKKLHQTLLESLSSSEKDPYVRKKYYVDLDLNFDLTGNPGQTSFYLAQTLEELGEWDSAIKYYSIFLRYPNTVIYGNPLANQKIREKVAFYNSDKSWTTNNIDTLIDNIKNAVWRQNISALDRYRSKSSFFAQTWEHKDSLLGHDEDFNAHDFLLEFLRKSRLSSGYSTVRFSNTLDVDSNQNEVYLRSEGWYYRIPIWYLYFQKVDYPKDPEINGRWEWAGIYFGEKL